MKSIINWMGNKKEIVDDIISHFPKTINNYYEPFIGSGIILIALLERILKKEIKLSGKIYCSDINTALIHMFLNIQSQCEAVISHIIEFQSLFNGNFPAYKKGSENNKFGIEHKKGVFFQFRDEYNKSSRMAVRDSALFIVILNTSFRGCYKESKNGMLNITCQSDRICKIDIDNIRYISGLIKDVVFTVSNYNSIQPENKDDFIYLDPPYVKVNNNSFTQYNQNNWVDIEFFNYCKKLNCSFIMSNNDCDEITLNFSGETYKKINLCCNKTANHKVRNEILITRTVSELITAEDLFFECIKLHSLKGVRDKLEINLSTINRWIKNKAVPEQYIFDLHRILNRPIDYSKYESSLKDQFFTPIDLAKKCFSIVKEKIEGVDNYTFIEPSVGSGNFLLLLPEGSIGLDIENNCSGTIVCDYLNWFPSDTKKYIVIGNPPFGLRGHTALKFINHSCEFAEYVCFILPKIFDSDGKGNITNRIKKYKLIYTENISDKFITVDSKAVFINCVFQIWKRSEVVSSNDPRSMPTAPLRSMPMVVSSDDNIKVYSLSNGPVYRNKKMIDCCDIYLPSSCYGAKNMKLYNSFEELPNKKGYGCVFSKNRDEYIEKAKSIEWSKVAILSTNSAYNLRTSIIQKNLIISN